MKTLLALSLQRRLWVCGWIAACTMVASHLGAQSVAPRITSDVNYSEQATLTGSLHPLALAQFDAGRMPAETSLNGVSIYFSRSAEQEADLQQLIAAQQDPTSPLYHQWLNPDQFAARFGMADSDLDKVKSWLQQQGFSIDSVARSRNMIRFSGTARQVEQAFLTEMHYYNVQGARHFAPSTELSVPAAFAPVFLNVRNLNDFRPRSMHVTPARPDFTSSQSGAVHFVPGDIKVAYNIPSSYTGTGQSIALMGQSAILTTDIENFQSAAGLTAKNPTLVLVPGTGLSRFYKGDESESDIDVEWSGGIATGANIIFVYVGSNPNYGAFDSLHYAVDEDIAPILSISYGTCETQLTTSEVSSMEAINAQAVAQGQTIIASSGDSGSTACFDYSGTTDGGATFTTTMDQALAVNYPASSAYVTAAGGTEITSANSVSTNSTYWDAQSTSDILTSAKVYIPEVAWNDDTLSGQYILAVGGGLSASGGGASALVSRPSWQAGTIGGVIIPTGTMRLVPDIALYSSPNYPGYLYCSSDPSDEIEGSCSNGFRDAYNKYLTVAGGTSFAAPIYAGMVAIINQAMGYTSGQGLVNPTLYTLAANNSTYTSAFNDVTSGNNYCTAGTTFGYCSATGATEGYAAGTGYDEVTGLGSVNLGNLITAWTPPPTPVIPTLVGTTTTITAATLAPASGVADTFTITVVAASGAVTPSGNVTLVIDGGTTSYSSGGSTATVALVASGTPGTATATYSKAFSTAGAHQIIAQFPSNATFALSSGVVQVVVGGTSSGVGSFTLGASPSTLTVSQGSSGKETITITPAGGYTGTVLMNYTTSNNTALENLNVCATNVHDGYASLQIVGTSAETTTFTFDTNASALYCEAASPVGSKPLHKPGATKTASNSGTNPAPFTVALAGLLLAGFLGRRSRKFLTMTGAIALLVVALTTSSCGGSSNSNTTPPTNPPPGTYTITITGQDSVTSSITAQTSFTFVIQ
jgi:subtilase family serine protease